MPGDTVTGCWPYPGDSPVVRARRVAHAYRAKLADIDPQACAQLDATMRKFGQQWAVPRVLTYDPAAWLNPTEAADLAGVRPDTLRIWRLRGLLVGRKTEAGEWEYRASDIIALTTKPRTRKKEQQ